MTPRLGLYVARIGMVMMVLCTAASAAAQITYTDGPAENTWGDNIMEMSILPVLWLAVAFEEETNFTLIGVLLLHAGGLLGFTVMALGLAIAGAGARVKECMPGGGRWVTLVGLVIALVCAVLVVSLDMGISHLSEPFGAWNPDATMKFQALWLLGGFLGFNLLVVGLVAAAVLAWTRQSGSPTARMTPGQGLYVAIIGCGMLVLCVEVRLIIPDGADDIVLVLIVCLGGFVGSVVIVVGLVMAAAGVFASHLMLH